MPSVVDEVRKDVPRNVLPQTTIVVSIVVSREQRVVCFLQDYTQGYWRTREAGHHINVLELLSLFKVCKAF